MRGAHRVACGIVSQQIREKLDAGAYSTYVFFAEIMRRLFVTLDQRHAEKEL